MSALADKIAKARRFVREIEGWRLTLRRPTDAEAAQLFKDEISNMDVATRFVCDWEGVKEADLIPSGSSDAAPFDADTWREVLADRPELWGPVTEAVINAWTDHNAKREGRQKN